MKLRTASLVGLFVAVPPFALPVYHNPTSPHRTRTGITHRLDQAPPVAAPPSGANYWISAVRLAPIKAAKVAHDAAVAAQLAAAQAAAAAAQAAQERFYEASKYAAGVAQAQQTSSSNYSVPSGGMWACIIQHESGGNPTIYNSSGSGASGLYQIMPGTWNNFDGYPSAASAPASVQTQKAEQLYQEAGWSPWAGDPCVG